MYGSQRDGFQIAGGFTFATIADTILEHKFYKGCIYKSIPKTK